MADLTEELAALSANLSTKRDDSSKYGPKKARNIPKALKRDQIYRPKPRDVVQERD